MPTMIKPHMVDGLLAYIEQQVAAATANLPALIASKVPSTSYTATDVLAKLKTVDGVGSGLDGDLFQGKALTDFLHFKVELGNTEDFNNLITNGMWHQAANANAATARNYPIALAGMLTVKLGSNGIMVYQQYQTYDNAYTYERVKFNGTWSAWKRILDSNRPMFSAHGPGAGLGPYDLKLANTRFNFGSMYNPATGIATIPQAGMWHIHYSGLNVASNSAHVQLAINGAVRVYSHSNYVGYSMDLLSWFGPLAVGDQVKVIVPSGYGVYASGGASDSYNRFWGVLEG